MTEKEFHKILQKVYKVTELEIELFFDYYKQFDLSNKTFEWFLKEANFHFSQNTINIDFYRWLVAQNKTTTEKVKNKFQNILNDEDYKFINGELEVNPRNRGY